MAAPLTSLETNEPAEDAEDAKDAKDAKDADASFQGVLACSPDELLPLLPAMGLMRPRSAFVLSACAIVVFSLWFVVDPTTVRRNLVFVVPLSLLPLAFAFIGNSVLKQLVGQRLVFRVERHALHTSGPNGQDSYDWTTFTSFDETATAFLLYRKRKVAHILPLRAFENADVPGIRALLETSLEKRTRPLRWRRNLFWAIAIVGTAIVWIVKS